MLLSSLQHITDRCGRREFATHTILYYMTFGLFWSIDYGGLTRFFCAPLLLSVILCAIACDHCSVELHMHSALVIGTIGQHIAPVHKVNSEPIVTSLCLGGLTAMITAHSVYFSTIHTTWGYINERRTQFAIAAFSIGMLGENSQRQY